MSLLELTSAYAAVARGRYPVVARGLPEAPAPEGLSAFFHRDGALERAPRPRADARPALRRGKRRHRPPRGAVHSDVRQDRHHPGQPRRLFVGFAGDLVVGVWVGRDDNGSLGKVSGGTVPAKSGAAS